MPNEDLKITSLRSLIKDASNECSNIDFDEVLDLICEDSREVLRKKMPFAHDLRERISDEEELSPGEITLLEESLKDSSINCSVRMDIANVKRISVQTLDYIFEHVRELPVVMIAIENMCSRTDDGKLPPEMVAILEARVNDDKDEGSSLIRVALENARPKSGPKSSPAM